MPAFAGVLGYAAFAQGAYYAPQGVAVAGALALVAVITRSGIGRQERPAQLAFGLLGAALLASAVAAGLPAVVWRPITTLISAAAAYALTRRAVRENQTDRLLSAVAWIGTVVAVIGIAGVVFHAFPWAMRLQGLWRASSTLTYANSAGAVLVLCLPAALILLMRSNRAVHRLQSYAIILCLIATVSRGAAVGAIAMTGILAVAGGRALIGAMLRPGLCALGAAVAMFPSIASWWPRPVHALAGVAGGAILVAIPLRLSVRARRFAAAGLAAATMAAIVPAVAATENPGQFVTSRIGEARDDRTIFWKTSLRTAAESPILGTGPGTYRGMLEDRGKWLLVFYVHNEYLQILAETGAVGLAAVLISIGVLASWAWRRRPPAGSDERILWAAGVAACAAFCVHGFFDFMWRMPAIVVPAFMWLALAAGREGRDAA